MAISEKEAACVYGTAKALFQEKKTVSLEDVSDYLRTVANTPMVTADIEECLTRLFEKQHNAPAVQLHQAFLFRKAAVGYWLGAYRIQVIEIRVEQSEEMRFTAYPFYGIADGARPKLLGIAFNTSSVLDYLKKQGVEIDQWFPIVNELSEESLKQLSMLSQNLNATQPIVFLIAS